MYEKKTTVLVIEDELINRRIIRKILEGSYDVIEAENGKEGLFICEEQATSIAAILLDLTMPIMNGYQFLEAIQKTSYRSIPIIVMTGSSDTETEQKALKAGAWDFIPKPYNAAILHIRLENAIARSKMALFEKIKHLSEHDTLTGLYNRTKMFAETRRMVQANPKNDFVFLRIDIDHFGLYNSSFGEAAGDSLLCYFADMIRRSAKAFGTAVYGRMNADVFCLCTLFEHGYEKLRRNMEIAQAELNEYSRDYLLKISSGAYVIHTSDAPVDVGEYYLRASLASQQCKDRFDSILEYYDDESRKKLDTSIEIANDMQRALDNNEFIVYFQPKYEVVSNTPCGAEALVRWQHPVKGLISPGRFIPVFEKNGFIAKVDYYVWEHTCKRLRRWMDAGKTPMPISVNISRVSLYNQKLDQVLVDLVQQYHIPPKLLELEITESAYMTSPELMHELVAKLHDAGFKILMDDFGSDYSSLNALKDIEVDVLKIDMAFIPKGNRVEKGEIILASMIKMARWLGMPVIVEGVETRKQRDFLEGAGCDMIQGYYYAKPLPPEKYEAQYVYTMWKKTQLLQNHFADTTKLGIILVIDDAEESREIIKNCLNPYYMVESCESAEDGMVFLRRNPDKVKLILVDNIMPGMTGIDFMRFCQNNNDLCCIPKVMITASDNVADQLAAFEAGAYDFITKPLVREVVAARVRHIMDTTYHHTSYDHVKQEYDIYAIRDPDTGLMTRKSFCDLSERMLSTFPQDPMALLLIDMDNFEQINEKCGYDKGTEILKHLARELRKEFRKSDVIGRVGGDEYAALLCGIPDKITAKQKSAEVLRAISFLGAREYGISISASIGLVYPIKADTIDTIIAKADQALSEAKHSRKGVCVIYGESVPPVMDDDKPVILVCGGDPLAFKELALAYGESAAFTFAQHLGTVITAFEKYKDRIAVICVDINTRVPENRNEFFQYLREQGGGDTIPILALCKLGEMKQLRLAVNRNICDLLPLPIQADLAQAQLSLAMMRRKK